MPVYIESGLFAPPGPSVIRIPSVLWVSGLKPAPGAGYLAGTFPKGTTTLDGMPTSAAIRVLYRPGRGIIGDGAVVADIQSHPDGTWRVDGLDPSLKFDVICRLEGYNDLILSDVSPVPY